VGEQLSASEGTWTGGATSFAYQWQRCDGSGGACVSITGATGTAYGVGSVDVGNTLRVAVTATNLTGSTNAVSAPTSLVAGISTTPPVLRHNHAPTIRFVSLRRVGVRVYARFSLCDDAPMAITLVETDMMPDRLGYSRHFSVMPEPCGTRTRSWILINRFRHAGRFTATLRAIDRSGASSLTVRRTIDFGAR
jgi:hypothetical protein